MSLRESEDGQLHTMEGVVAALVLIFAILYITGAINLVSPQTEKAAVMKESIRAEDTLTVLGSVDQPSNYSSMLLRDVSAWKGSEVNYSKEEVDPGGESSIMALDSTIYSMLPPNIIYNLYVTYWDDGANAMKTKTLIYRGEPHDNAVSASKKIVLNGGDVEALPSSYWYPLVMSGTVSEVKALEIRLVMWSI
jgi:hypothetical protein